MVVINNMCRRRWLCEMHVPIWMAVQRTLAAQYHNLRSTSALYTFSSHKSWILVSTNPSNKWMNGMNEKESLNLVLLCFKVIAVAGAHTHVPFTKNIPIIIIFLMNPPLAPSILVEVGAKWMANKMLGIIHRPTDQVSRDWNELNSE